MLIIRNERMRWVLRWALPLVLIPAVVLVGNALPRRFLPLVILVVAVLTLLLFVAGFEQKKIGARRMVLVSVLIALSVVGRFLPIFKPVTALTVIAAVWLGAESGFFVGAFSALLSNFFFGQGPWTPFQMLAWGLIGLLAGLLSRPLQRSRVAMLCYGAISGVIFSLVMDVWNALWYSGGFSLRVYGAAVLTALPHTLLYTLSNVVFLWLLARPFGEKLQRIKIKYGV